MSLARIDWAPRLVPRLVSSGCFHRDPLLLADVGCSGGEERYWHAFGDALHVVGFDPLVREIERLNQARPSDRFEYVAAYVGCPEREAEFQDPALLDPVASRSNQSFPRTSAMRAARLLAYSSDRAYQDGDAQVVHAARRISIDAFAATHPLPIDFLKIDTDGHDIEVLYGAEKTLDSAPVLGLMVESQFHGALHERANTFANVDRLLRSHGFSLFDLEVHRYSRAELPLPFVYALPGQTRGGQAAWGDALYLRDFANPHYEAQWGLRPSAPMLLKLCGIFELHGLGDCAAEILLRFAETLDPLLSAHAVGSRELLDLLTPECAQRRIGHAEYVAAFEKDPRSFFPAAPEADTWRGRLGDALRRARARLREPG